MAFVSLSARPPPFLSFLRHGLAFPWTRSMTIGTAEMKTKHPNTASKQAHTTMVNEECLWEHSDAEAYASDELDPSPPMPRGAPPWLSLLLVSPPLSPPLPPAPSSRFDFQHRVVMKGKGECVFRLGRFVDAYCVGEQRKETS